MNPILKLLSELSRLDVEYCSWKNNYLLYSTTMRRDLDLLINSRKKMLSEDF